MKFSVLIAAALASTAFALPRPQGETDAAPVDDTSSEAPALDEGATLDEASLDGPEAEASTTSTSGGGSYGITLEAPTGKYCVGKTNAKFLKDNSRNNPYGSGKREVLVEVYYPRSQKKVGNGANCISYEPYMTYTVAEATRRYFGNFTTDAAFLQNIKHHAKTNAAPLTNAGSDQRVLISSHGFGCSREIYQGQYQELASQGHFVVVVEHPGDSIVIDEQGRKIYQDAVLAGLPLDTRPEFTANVEVRTEDILFVGKKLFDKNITLPGAPSDVKPLLNRKVGYFGHSMGGQLGLNVALRKGKDHTGVTNNDLKTFPYAVVNGDGWYWSKGNATANLSASDMKRPIMTLRSDKSNPPAPYSWIAGGPRNEVNTMRAQTGPKIAPEYPTSAHFWPSDVVQWAAKGTPAQRTALKNGAIGQIDGLKAWKIQITYLKWFFSKALYGQDTQVSAASAPTFPEIFFRNINGPVDTTPL